MNRHFHTGLGLLPLVFVAVTNLTACVFAPLSFIQGTPQTLTDFTLYPVRIVSVDGSIQFARPSKPIQISPGSRSIVFEATPGSGARNGVQKSFALKVEPCTRYFLAARRQLAMDADWSLVVDKTEAVPGCNIEDELQKAAVAANSQNN